MVKTFSVTLDIPYDMCTDDVERALSMVPLPFGIDLIRVRDELPGMGGQFGDGNVQYNSFLPWREG